MSKTKNNKYQSISIHKYLLMSVISLGIFFGLVQGAEAANHYVRQGATGANNGSDWTNAWTSLPSNLTRGDTYYIADGSYGSYIFDDSVFGATYIYIKKATLSDHGTDTGWSSTYGSGQVIFSGNSSTWSIRTGYYDIDGINGHGTTDYGIKVLSTNSTENTSTVQITYGTNASNLSFKHIEFQGEITGTRVFWDNSYSSDNMRFSNNYFHGGRVWIAMSSDNIILERNYFKDARSDDGSLHGAGIVINGNNTTIRYNTLENVIGAMTTYIEPQVNRNGVYIYGNIFKATSSSEKTSQGILAITSTDTATNVYVYNNTIYGLHGSSPGVWCGNVAGSSCTVQNNIWQDTSSVNCSRCAVFTNNDLPTDSVSFVNAPGGDFHLLQATRAGNSLGVPYTEDMDGVVRGSDGTWDRGAFEYASDVPPDTTPPSAITNLSASNPTSNSITLNWTSPGDDGNTGTASSYDIRYSTSNITEANWSSATQVSDEPTPLVASSSQLMIVSGLLPSTTYYLAMKTRDEVLANWSDISNVPSATTAEAPSGLIEAEFGTIASPMEIVSDDQASGGKYIQTPTADSGTATYTFNIPETGIYKIVARVYAANLGQDSLFFKIDSQTEDIWDFNPPETDEGYNVWREDELTKRGTGTVNNPQYDPYTLELTQGSHTLTFRGREANAKLDYFRFAQTDDTTPPAAPTGLQVN